MMRLRLMRLWLNHNGACSLGKFIFPKLVDEISEELDIFGGGGELAVLAGGYDLDDLIVDGSCDAVLSAELCQRFRQSVHQRRL